MTVYSLVGHWLEIELARDLVDQTPVTLDRILDSMERNRLTRLVRLGTWFLTCVGFVILMYRIGRSAREAGAHGMRMSPGMAAGTFFIPVYNFVGPYLAMQDAWRGTAPTAIVRNDESKESADYSEEDLQRTSPSNLIRLWWLLWIVSRTTAVVTNSVGDTPQAIIEAHQFQMVSNGIDLVLTVVTVLMIQAVSSRIEQKWWNEHGGRIPRARASGVEVNHA
ncbi:MAG: DUF4328 domain-containing protein [Kofleriaceae bacterium]|nr:DUF4328 domain-containing protein [Kofleriaceae bacterium]